MKASTLRLLFNLYPPYWGTGIRVREIAEDYRRVVVEMPPDWESSRRKKKCRHS